MADRYDVKNLYSSNNISTYDSGHPKPNLKSKPKTKADDNILMNDSIKKVMQKNRELKKELEKYKTENEKLKRENKKLKKKN